MRTTHFNNILRLRWAALVGLIVVVTLAGCQGQAPVVPKTPGAPAAALPAVESSDVIKADQGGAITLNDGARLAIPPGALAADTKVTFGPGRIAPIVPVPRALLGRGYDFALDGGELTGVALLTLPLPADVTSPPYDVAPYLWNGKTWERLNGRMAAGGIQFGANRPGVYALLGQWSLADAVVDLARPEATPGQQTAPLVTTGQYRYAALPMQQDGYVQARLTLKQDTSGGAGRVIGDETLDRTVDEAQLLFKPDPAQSQGAIDFSHTFQLAPGALELNPGETTRFYTVLTVTDSAAPTRRLSNGVEYTQLLPIQAVGRAIVRPKLAVEGGQDLRWRIQRDGQPFAFERAAATELPFEPFLAQGGLGDYRFTLETQRNGDWVTVSNDVNIKLTVPTTATPPGELAAAPGGTPGVPVTPAPGTGEPVPVGTPPSPPTRRPTPGNGAGVEPSATPTAAAVAAVATATRTRTAAESVFWADRYNLASGECTNLHWDLQGVDKIYLDDVGVTGNDTQEKCPKQTTTYTLRSISSTGTQDRSVTIVVGAGADVGVEFTTDTNEVVVGQCATLRWRAVNVREVYLGTQGVRGEYSKPVCPQADTTYELRVVNMDGSTTTKKQFIKVVSADTPIIRFWAEQYSLPSGACTILNWNVQNVQKVFLNGQGVSSPGATTVCPNADEVFTLKVIAHSGEAVEREISLWVNPLVEPTEIIARGIVQQVNQTPDADPTQPDDQGGYQLTVDGIKTLFPSTPGWGQMVVYLRVPQTDTAASANPDAAVDWPITPGQTVEFRAFCEGANCYVRTDQGSYLHLRSQ